MMDMQTMLTAPRFTMTDLEVALGLKERSGVARLLLQRLRESGVDSYGNLATPTTEPDVAADGGVGEEPSAGGRGWSRFSVLDIFWVALMRDVEAIQNMSALEFASMAAYFQALELGRDGSIARRAGLEPPDGGRDRRPTFAEYIHRLLDGGSEPYLAIVCGNAGKIGVHERTSAGIPGNVVISDNPVLVQRLFTQLVAPLGGHLHVFPFRAMVTQVLQNLRPRTAGAVGLPDLPPYRQPELQDAKLTEAERQLMAVIHDAPALAPDVRLRVMNHEIESITYEQSHGPKEFSVKKALEDARTLQVRTLRCEEGTVRKYAVEKRVSF
jgi:hypothetical protein